MPVLLIVWPPWPFSCSKGSRNSCICSAGRPGSEALGGVGFLEIDVPHVVLTSFAVLPVIKLAGFLFGLPFPDLLFVPELLRRFYAHAAVE